MQVFITGGSGYVGGAVVRELVRAGHEVTALSRSAGADERLAAAGAEPLRGELTALDVLARAATAADVVVHAAVDYADPAFGEVEGPALAALVHAAAGAVVYLSTTLVYGDTGPDPAAETRPAAPLVQAFKVDGERATLARGGTVLRPGLAYGLPGSALLDGMHAAAREQGAVRYVGHGTNRWSLVHAGDLADAVRRCVETRPRGAVLNVAAEPAPSMREIARTIAAEHGVPAVPLPVDEAAAAMGDFADQLTRDLVVDASRAREVLGWSPGAELLAA